jgi:hypothetical protein
VAVLLIAGDQFPENPFVEFVGRVKVPPEQIGAMVLNVGVCGAPTLTVIVAVVAQDPDEGVKV